MRVTDFWYILCESNELKKNQLKAVQLLNEWLVLFRDDVGRPVALQDRCLHRGARLSSGTVRNGCLQCCYHGWVYDGEGRVVQIPAQSPERIKKPSRQAKTFRVKEQDDYIYVNLSERTETAVDPFSVPFYKAPGWEHLRLKNLIKNNVTNCVENFVDIPHTVFVHPTIFRNVRNEKIRATIERKEGTVFVRYHEERANLGIFSWFLNPGGAEISHTDAFYMPNVTSVDYQFSAKRRFIITSQSVPVKEDETLVYTDLTYNYGIWNRLSRPIIRWQAQTIIDQDVDILANQMEGIKKYGARFNSSEVDLIHVMIESIRAELDKDGNPLGLPEKKYEVEFWV